MIGVRPSGPEPVPPGATPPSRLASEPPAELSTPAPAFAHASEAELARILDFYDVRWEYEPHTFPILWSLDGTVVESFSPDFYLPDLDLYIELTTLKQKLVRKKNRKLRRLRELYPDIRIKLFYARDFKMLMLKFGRVDLFDELSGTTGQVTPQRQHDVPGEVDGPGVSEQDLLGAAPRPTSTPGPPGAADDGPRDVDLATRRTPRRRRRQRGRDARSTPPAAAPAEAGARRED